MAKRRKINPDASALGRDIDDVIHGSGSAIDAVYAEYRDVDRDGDSLEFLKDNLEENKQSVPLKLRSRLAAGRLRRRELDRRIARYGTAMLKRIKGSLEIVKASPGASFNRDAIRDVERRIFKVATRIKTSGTDVRGLISELLGDIATLEKDSGIVLRRPGKKMDATSRRKSEEAQIYADVVGEWKKVYSHAKRDPRVKEDLEWVTLQLRSLDIKFKRGESIRRSLERVAKKIHDIHNRTKPRKELKTFAQAKRGIGEFVVAIQEYAESGDVSSSGIDRLQRELETFSRRFPPTAKAGWEKGDQRKFASDLRKIRLALDALRPKRGRKKNPCVGLHFHGKDADDLLKALEDSGKRQGKPKKNPGGPYHPESPEHYYVPDFLEWLRKRPELNRVAKRAHELRMCLWDDVDAFASTQRQRRAKISNTEILRLYERHLVGREPYPKPAPRKRLALTPKQIAAAFREKNPGKKNPADPEEVLLFGSAGPYPLSKIDLAAFFSNETGSKAGFSRALTTAKRDGFVKESKGAIRLTSKGTKRLLEIAPDITDNPRVNPKKKASKRKKTPQSRLLTNRCQKLWDSYCEKPTKKNLRVVLDHLEKMKLSSSKVVKRERSACLRIANKEAKRLGMK